MAGSVTNGDTGEWKELIISLNDFQGQGQLDLYRFSKGLPPNLFSNNRGVNPLATAFVVTGFTPGLICQKEQSFLEVVLDADLILRYDGGDDTLFHLLEIDRTAL